MATTMATTQHIRLTLPEAIQLHKDQIINCTTLVLVFFKCHLAPGWRRKFSPKSIRELLGISESSYQRAVCKLRLKKMLYWKDEGYIMYSLSPMGDEEVAEVAPPLSLEIKEVEAPQPQPQPTYPEIESIITEVAKTSMVSPVSSEVTTVSSEVTTVSSESYTVNYERQAGFQGMIVNESSGLSSISQILSSSFSSPPEKEEKKENEEKIKSKPRKKVVLEEGQKINLTINCDRNTETPWIDESGKFYPEFILSVAEEWRNAWGGSISENKAKVLSHFAKNPEKVQIRWDGFVQTLAETCQKIKLREQNGMMIDESEVNLLNLHYSIIGEVAAPKSDYGEGGCYRPYEPEKIENPITSEQWAELRARIKQVTGVSCS
jgi:hypothetical protein